MQSRRLTTASKKRRGFTLIELLVVISIIATLMSLILPAIQNAREAGRRTQCLNNMRNVTVALHNFASSNKSRLPALAYFPTNGSAGNIEGRSWVVELLPFMDAQGTADRWNKNVAWNAAPNQNLANDLYIEALVCPNDESAFQTPGGLTYVANAGFGDDDPAADSITNAGGALHHSFAIEPFDWDGDTNTPQSVGGDADDEEITKATGVFWPEYDNPAALNSATRNSSVTLGKVYDGTSNTLMLGENIKSGVSSSTWADPRTRACAFMFPLDATTVTAGSLNNPVPLIGVDSAGNDLLAYPNDSKNANQGDAPYLNSAHPGIVVVAFVDGSTSTISEDIDRLVYTSLMTPAGTRLRNNAAGTSMAVEDPVSADSY